MESHINQVISLRKNCPQRAAIVRNTAYIFHSGAVMQHDKRAPWNETYSDPHSVFQPPKGNNLNHCFELTHPITQEKFNIGVEICREHYIGTLKASGEKRPLIHFVLSATLRDVTENIYGNYFLHVDSRAAISKGLRVQNGMPPQVMISAYSHNLLAPSKDNLQARELINDCAYTTRLTMSLFKKMREQPTVDLEPAAKWSKK